MGAGSGTSSPRSWGMKLDWKPGWNFVRERQMPPGRCVQGSYLTVTPVAGLRVVTCMDRKTGVRTPQTILHHVERFAIRHPELWQEVQEERIVDLRGRKHGYSGASGFGAMFGEQKTFKNKSELVQWFVQSEHFQNQIREREEKRKMRNAQAKERRRRKDAEMRANGIDPKAERRRKRKQTKLAKQSMINEPEYTMSGFDGMFASDEQEKIKMTFETDDAVMAFLNMIGPKGYDGMFR